MSEQRPLAADLHVCHGCGSGLVQPCGELPRPQTGDWHVWLQCPDCGWTDARVCEEEALERFDEELDRGADELFGQLARMEGEHMREYTDHFVAALRADLISADDF